VPILFATLRRCDGDGKTRDDEVTTRIRTTGFGSSISLQAAGPPQRRRGYGPAGEFFLAWPGAIHTRSNFELGPRRLGPPTRPLWSAFQGV
jgi:hypothetical protein